MEAINRFINDYLVWLSIPEINFIDIIEMLLIAFAIYHIIIWVKNTRAWMLVKGIIVLLVICLIATILNMNVILWIFSKTIGVGITAVIIVFQPELRRALEQLGRKNLITSILIFDEQKNKSEKLALRTINEIVKATFERAKTKTGALIVMENE